MGVVIFILGCFSAVSIQNWDAFPGMAKTLQAWFGGARASFFDLVDNLSCNWLLPLGGLFICLFVGWIWGTHRAVAEIRHGSDNFGDVHLMSLLAGLKEDPSHSDPSHAVTLASLWGLFVRFICPIAILITFLHTIGWLNFKPAEKPAPPPAVAVSEVQQP